MPCYKVGSELQLIKAETTFFMSRHTFSGENCDGARKNNDRFPVTTRHTNVRQESSKTSTAVSLIPGLS